MGLGKPKRCGTKTRKWIPLLFVALWMPVTWARGELTGKIGADPSEGKAPAALGPGRGSSESACEQYRHRHQKHPSPPPSSGNPRPNGLSPTPQLSLLRALNTNPLC